MRATINDIAKDAHVSITTVSLVLNHKSHRISQSTCEAVMRSAEKLGYRPNQLAVGLVKKRTYTIGVIVSDISNLFFSTLIKAVEETCHSEGWNVMICNSDDNPDWERDYIQMLADKGVDGIIYGMSVKTTPELAQEHCTLMEKLGIPFVMVDRYILESGYPYIAVDHRKGGFLATRHLIKLGHRQIVCITGPSHLQDSKERLEGYCQALLEAGIAYDPSLIREGDYSRNGGKRAIAKLLQEEKKFTAVFAFNDLSAIGAYNELRTQGISIPGEVSLVGYDDVLLSGLLDTPLTTVHQPVAEMGKRAASLLLDLVEERPLDSRVNLIPYLSIRSSTRNIKK